MSTGLFYQAARLVSPNISEIESIVGSKKAFSVTIGENTFRLNKLNVTTRLNFIRRLGSMFGEVDNLMLMVTKGVAMRAKKMEAEAIIEFTQAAPKIVAALCNEQFEALIIECAKNAFLKTPKEFVSLNDEDTLNDAVGDQTSNLIALGLCYLEVNAQDFLKQMGDIIQSRLKQTVVSTDISSPKAMPEPPQSEVATA
jgi:hypothetical protein